MTIEEQLDRLNRTTWIVMTEPDVNKKWFNINITSILNDLYKDGYLICVGDKELNTMYEDDAETDKFDDMIDEAEEGLIAYRKLHPDAIAFFTKTDWNKITLKYCPYHLFQELILHKTALIKN